MNIAICDDESVFLRTLHKKINDMKLPDCNVYEFTSGRELLNNTVEGKFEIIILDVEMPEINGLKVAEMIRRTDKNVIISFLTNYAEFAVQGYEVDAFRYILKTQPDYILKQQLESIFEECRQRFRTYSFKNRNMSFTFKLDDIISFEVNGRIITLTTQKGTIEYYGNFSEICDELIPYNFVKTNKGILINIEHIQKILKNDVHLTSGIVFPIGRTYKDKIIAKYTNFATRR